MQKDVLTKALPTSSESALTDDGSCEYCPIVNGVDITAVLYNCYDYVWTFGYSVDDMTDIGLIVHVLPEPVYGCGDDTACNYNVDGVDLIDNFTCVYADAGYDCAGARQQMLMLMVFVMTLICVLKMLPMHVQVVQMNSQ